jgi:hypothetical protein
VQNYLTNLHLFRHAGPDGLHEGDWICPKCDNVNFAFRTTCNIKKCGAPRPSTVSDFMDIHFLFSDGHHCSVWHCSKNCCVWFVMLMERLCRKSTLSQVSSNLLYVMWPFIIPGSKPWWSNSHHPSISTLSNIFSLGSFSLSSFLLLFSVPKIYKFSVSLSDIL